MIETSVVKLWAEYKCFKEQWRKLTERGKISDRWAWMVYHHRPDFLQNSHRIKGCNEAADILNSDDSSEDGEYNEKEDAIE